MKGDASLTGNSSRNQRDRRLAAAAVAKIVENGTAEEACGSDAIANPAHGYVVGPLRDRIAVVARGLVEIVSHAVRFDIQDHGCHQRRRAHGTGSDTGHAQPTAPRRGVGGVCTTVGAGVGEGSGLCTITVGEGASPCTIGAGGAGCEVSADRCSCFDR